ncbi:MAG: hypothetical protein ACLT76_00010 [Clostridium fessum]
MKKNSWKIRALALTLMAVCWLSGCSAHKEISVTAAETQEETRELSLNARDGGRNAAGSRAGGTLRKRREDTELSDRGMDGCRKGKPPSARNHDEQ